MQPKLVDGRLVNTHNGTWNHQMCVIGYDGATGSQPYYYILNSWGAAAHGNPPDGAPPGGFWVAEKDITYIVSQNDSWAFSNFDAFPSQELDWRIIGLNGANPPPQKNEGEIEMSELLIIAVGMIVLGVLLLLLEVSKKRHGLLPSILLFAIVILILASRCDAGFIDFSVIGSGEVRYQPDDYQSHFAASKNLDFCVLGRSSFKSNKVNLTSANKIVDMKKTKPTIFVYTMPGCPPCKKLKEQIPQLPGFNFVIEELGTGDVPNWVSKYPTLHWEGSGGKWWIRKGWPGPKKFKAIYEKYAAKNDNMRVKKPHF